MLRWCTVLAVVAAITAAVGLSGCGVGGDGSRLRLPGGLPADVPLPQSAVLRTARDLGDKGLSLVFETEEPAAAVGDRLRVRLEAGGWVLLSEVTVESAVFASYRKGVRSLAFGISNTGGVTTVGMAYQQPEPVREGDQG